MRSQPPHCSTDAITYSSLSKGSLVVARPNNVVAKSFSAEDHAPDSEVLLKFQPQAIGCYQGKLIRVNEICLPLRRDDHISAFEVKRLDSNPCLAHTA